MAVGTRSGFREKARGVHRSIMAHYKKPRNDYDFFKFLGNITALQEEKDRQQDKMLEDAIPLLGRWAKELNEDPMWETLRSDIREIALKNLERRELPSVSCAEGAD